MVTEIPSHQKLCASCFHPYWLFYPGHGAQQLYLHLPLTGRPQRSEHSPVTEYLSSWEAFFLKCSLFLWLQDRFQRLWWTRPRRCSRRRYVQSYLWPIASWFSAALTAMRTACVCPRGHYVWEACVHTPNVVQHVPCGETRVSCVVDNNHNHGNLIEAFFLLLYDQRQWVELVLPVSYLLSDWNYLSQCVYVGVCVCEKPESNAGFSVWAVTPISVRVGTKEPSFNIQAAWKQ